MDLRMDALRILMPNGYGYSGNETDYVITKPDDSDDKIPTLEEMNSKVAELRKDYEALQYQRDREPEYPSIPDQLDEIYHNGIDSWKAIIKQTKDKYPKG